MKKKTAVLVFLVVFFAAGCAEQDYDFDEWMRAQDWYQPNPTEQTSADPDPDFMRRWHEGFECRKDRELLLEMQRRALQQQAETLNRLLDAWEYNQSPWLTHPNPYYWQENLARQQYYDYYAP